MELDRIERLERRALRHRARGELRKAANAYGELTSVVPEAARYWVLRAAALAALAQLEEAARCLKQAQWLLRRAHEERRATAVRGLLQGLALGGAPQGRAPRLQLLLAA